MDSPFPDHAQMSNAPLIEELYEKYRENPQSVDPSWRHFFEGIAFAAYLSKQGGEMAATAQPQLRVFELVQLYRRKGHLNAQFNPIRKASVDLKEGLISANELEQIYPTLGFCASKEAPLREIISSLEAIYSSRIGFEYMDLGNAALEEWVQNHIEPRLAIDLPLEEKHILLDLLSQAEMLETFLHTKYVGQTRFSLEGGETMIPVLRELVERGAELGIEQFYLGMAHRGRLNVLANILNKPYSSLFNEFEDDTTLSYSGNDDVKYHLGFSAEVATRSGKKVSLSLAANPSHLESVDPVVVGETYAKQIVASDTEKKRIGAILIHGDASLAGQGVIYETLQLMRLPSYSIGGTLHLVVNNQIGYTTVPEEGRSTRYCTDIAKTFGCPVFHVNAEDPESCLLAAIWALEIRQRFQIDVFIDLVCYRKYGHNEGDEPSFTQPIQYAQIRAKKSIRQLYLEELLAKGSTQEGLAQDFEAAYKEKLAQALAQSQGQKKAPTEERPRAAKLLDPFPSAVPTPTLIEVIQTFCTVPSDFHLHVKLKKWLKDRLDAVTGDPDKKGIDWSTAECLAFGTLLKEGISIRLAGQDAKRGTFSQRHIVWTDSEDAHLHSPLSSFTGRFDAINSPLTEFAGMGFEYGYTWGSPEALVLWEAQYGDFDNGAQIIIDQYIVSAEQKWNTPSSLALLLPHAYEGAGPEHSSARLERFLQLCADNNIQVVNASTPAQYFHLLRRQALRKVKKPLIVFTPKSLLRAAACTSSLHDLAHGHFEEILGDVVLSPKRVIFCSGKVYYDLLSKREERTDIALIRIEQIYPLHEEKLRTVFAQYKGCKSFVFVQEEPENGGAWSYLALKFPSVAPAGITVQYLGRPGSPTTATGSHLKHKKEQQALIERALEV